MPETNSLVSTEDLQQALTALAHAQAAPILRLAQEADVAKRAVVRMRDEAILRLRGQPGDPHASLWRSALDRLNVALTLIVAIENPTSGLQRDQIQQAQEVLRGLG